MGSNTNWKSAAQRISLEHLPPNLRGVAAQAWAAAACMEASEAGIRALQNEVYAVVDQLRLDAPTACGAGCSTCCRQKVAALPYEVALAYLDSPAPQLEEAVRVARSVPKHRQRVNVPCPLLDSGQRCTIYASRPAACRLEHSLSREACEMGPGYAHPKDGRRELVGYAVTLGESKGLLGQGFDVSPIELIAGLAYLAGEHGEDRSGPLQAWLAGAQIFPDSLRIPLALPDFSRRSAEGLDLVQLRRGNRVKVSG